jgi:hypothetical protein
VSSSVLESVIVIPLVDVMPQCHQPRRSESSEESER